MFLMSLLLKCVMISQKDDNCSEKEKFLARRNYKEKEKFLARKNYKYLK